MANRALRDAFGAFPTGVTVVTTCDSAGEPVGVTVNSFVSLSLEPPLVAWSLNNNSPSRAAFEQGPYFAVNVLSVDQIALSRRFGASLPEKFAGVPTRAGLGGVPLVSGAAAHFECRLIASHPGGDHVLFIGEVARYAHQRSRKPLLFYAGRYHDVGDPLD